jgi:trans-aconitate 2-methyltransferase
MAHEFDGRKYEKASSHQREWGEKLIEEFALEGTERILDLGCGDGTLTVQISTLVPNGGVVGVDASKGMIEAAKPKERENVRFLLMDINDLAFEQEFEVVFSNATLHWVHNHRRLLGQVRHLLTPSGIVRFNFAGDGNCSFFFKVIRESMNLPHFSTYFEGFSWPWYMPTVEEYSALVRSTGFEEIDVWGENADRYFPDEDAMIRWIDQPSLVPFMIRIAEPDKVSFREFVVNRMIQETKQADGKCFETFRRINVYARK